MAKDRTHMYLIQVDDFLFLVWDSISETSRIVKLEVVVKYELVSLFVIWSTNKHGLI
jgi:hypothetical protein